MATPSSSSGSMGVKDTWKSHLGLAMVQLFYGGYHVITKVALNDGVNQLVFCFYRDLLAFCILAPIAFFKERQTRPPIDKKLLMSFFFLGLTGTESVNLLRCEGLAKVGGTVICVSGAILMVFYRGPAVIGYRDGGHETQSEIRARGQTEPSGWLISGLQDLGLDHFKLGVICLIGNTLCMAAFLAFQAPVLKKYPANLSVTTYSFFFGVVLMVIMSLFITDGPSDWILTQSEILAVIYAGTIASALNYGIMTWSNKILGPALVALYMPLQPLFSSVMSQIFLGSQIYMGSIIGGSFIIAGLFVVTWASYRERQATAGVTPGSWVSEPLLHGKIADHIDHLFSGSSSVSPNPKSSD
ncbi:WAT1-related protein At4g19185-like isoform X2 [Lotus japonicus]|uniref:WAT1-related protein At4g19185-like isoform X2 n=1 Tax=Lotus japonicus TaxID=34305 RepID=UPI00258D11AD|nr:WAT1-related protein At4g19185-like isoform X2 [Lotus japonicus]